MGFFIFFFISFGYAGERELLWSLSCFGVWFSQGVISGGPNGVWFSQLQAKTLFIGFVFFAFSFSLFL
jgi:hypothetical protein